MSERMTDLPEWVWVAIEAILKYEDEHPMLYRERIGGEGYESTPCLGHSLEPLIPAEVWQAAEVMRARASRAVSA